MKKQLHIVFEENLIMNSLHKILIGLFTVAVLSTNLLAKEKSAEELCNIEVKKELINKLKVQEYCSEAGKHYEEKEEFGSASWYYLLGGKLNYNIKSLKKKIKENDTVIYANIAHSLILKNNIKEAKELYRKFLNNAEIYWADEATQDDYKLLYKLYPNQKKNLDIGLNFWNKIYKPLNVEIFNKLFDMKMIIPSKGYFSIKIRNYNPLKIKRMHLFLNPPMDIPNDNDNGFEIAKKIFNTGSFLLTKEGFRAPARKNYYYTNIMPGEEFSVSYKKFIHTKTKEKFSKNRYQLDTIYIGLEIEYKGDTYERFEIYKF
ncbi:MAG: hypothetical protein U9N59_15955 [Campylobacterota bacterium]|nr:hypothetical protein [Campylobacterota bacterium]